MELALTFMMADCCTKIFKINEIVAYSGDFGVQYDTSPETAEAYCCGDMQFMGDPATPEVLKKYGINQTEYAVIVEMLERGLSFGCCDWCS